MSISWGVVTLYAVGSDQLELKRMFIVLDFSNIGRSHPAIVFLLSATSGHSQDYRGGLRCSRKGHSYISGLCCFPANTRHAPNFPECLFELFSDVRALVQLT